MKNYIKLLPILLTLLSCTEREKITEKSGEYTNLNTIIDTLSQPAEKPTNSWLKDSVISENILFYNTITLTDGQRNSAGVSFLMEDKNDIVLVSANHLIGPDGGFDKLLNYEELKKQLSKWEVSNFETNEIFVSPGLSQRKNHFDAIFLNITPEMTKNKKVLKKEHSMPTTPGEVCYLVGFNMPDIHSVRRIDFTYLETGKDENLAAYAYLEKYKLMGKSGAPIVSKNGKVIGILRAKGIATEQMKANGIAVAIIQNFN